jgi:hypothetical protein
VLGYKDADGSPWTSASNRPGYYKRNIYGLQAKLTHDLGATTLTAISDYLAVIKHSSNSVDMSPTPSSSMASIRPTTSSRRSCG